MNEQQRLLDSPAPGLSMEGAFPKSFEHQIDVVMGQPGLLCNCRVDDARHREDCEGHDVCGPDRPLRGALALAFAAAVFLVSGRHHDRALSVDALHRVQGVSPAKLHGTSQLELLFATIAAPNSLTSTAARHRTSFISSN